MPKLLSIRNLHVSVDDHEIIKGIDMDVEEGELHVIMGPNGSGKSTFVNTIMGHPSYLVTKGDIGFRGKDLLAMEPHERARLGLFLAFQYPKEITGVTLRNFLYAAYKAQAETRMPSEKRLTPFKFQQILQKKMEALHMHASFAERFVNQGFSGGEKKKAEVLQLHILRPLLALLDETDSGLDIDALRLVAEGVHQMRSPTFSGIIVTHYARILDYINPDRVHVMLRGAIVESGGAELAQKLEKEGYQKFALS